MVERENCVSIYTLNTWTDEHWKKAEEALEKGLAVHFGCTAIGHSLSERVEYEAEKWVRDNYGDRVEEVYPDYFPFVHFRLRKEN